MTLLGDATQTDGDTVCTEHLDVVIVGAGLSGIGAACQLRRRRPGTTFAVLEARGTLGGTWDLFRYPGVRSDSDMFTLAYSFKPWRSARSIVGAEAVRDYLHEAAEEFDVTGAIRYGHRVVKASWSSAQARWTLQVEVTEPAATGDDGAAPATGRAATRQVRLTARMLFTATGYFSYDAGYTPDIPGLASFDGRVVHPQDWPADLDVTGRQVAVVGSGATAVTLVPALAASAAHVTMVQRSPTWMVSAPRTDTLDERLLRLPAPLAGRLVRWRHILLATGLYELTRRRPATARRWLRAHVAARLAARDATDAASAVATHDVDADFTPTYDPWDQRLCLVADGDLFAALREGRASVVTGRIEAVTATGLTLDGGREIDADVIVTATGLRLELLGSMSVSVDGARIDPARRVVYRGAMLSGVPNLLFAIGYANASWTLKIDLVTRYLCRLLDHLDAVGATTVTPTQPPTPERTPLITLTSSYVRRDAAIIPEQGASFPWRVPGNHLATATRMRWSPLLDDGVRVSGSASVTRRG